MIVPGKRCSIVRTTGPESGVAGDGAAGHRERAVLDHEHAAASFVSVVNGVVRDRAARHLKRAECVHEHAAAAVAGDVPGDRAALEAEHGVASNVHAMVSAARHGACGEAVREREVAAGADVEDLLAAVEGNRVAVQVERDGVRDRQHRVAVRSGHVVR